MKESKLQNIVKKFYENSGCMVYKTMGGFVKGANYTAAPGWPDLMIFDEEGHMFFIECKNETGKLRDTQIVRIKQLFNLGHVVLIARPGGDDFYLQTVQISDEDYRAAELRIKEYKEKKKLKRLEAKLNENN
jgi:hypothetical protein